MVRTKSASLGVGHLAQKRVEIQAGRRVDESLGGSVEGIGVLVVSKYPATGEITVSAAGVISLASDAEAVALADALREAVRFVTSVP